MLMKNSMIFGVIVPWVFVIINYFLYSIFKITSFEHFVSLCLVMLVTMIGSYILCH
jgi:hypothetical protein